VAHAIALDTEPAPSDWISVAPQHETPDIAAALMRIATSARISPLRVMSDFVRLSFGPGKVSFRDYNRLKLFDREFWANEDRRQVVGQLRNVDIWTAINFRQDWWGFFDNKLASCAYLSAFGLPVIPNLAIYRENLKIHGAQVASDKEELRNFLRSEDHYPLFGKPTDGLQSLGSVALRHYLPDRDSVETFDGHIIKLDAFIAEIAKHYAAGYLFQRLVLPHAAIRAVCGERLATIRVITLRPGMEAPQVLRVCWKIPAGKNMADNYWRKGNLLAKLDPNTGEVLRVLSGTGVDLAQHSHHPDTNAPLIGFRLPQWQAIIATVTEAARLMEQAALIGWDVAVLDDGPVIVEMNERPDFILPQLADGRGILDAQLLDFMAGQKKKSVERRQALKRENKNL
jgi:hypothetical protein